MINQKRERGQKGGGILARRPSSPRDHFSYLAARQRNLKMRPLMPQFRGSLKDVSSTTLLNDQRDNGRREQVAPLTAVSDISAQSGSIKHRAGESLSVTSFWIHNIQYTFYNSLNDHKCQCRAHATRTLALQPSWDPNLLTRSPRVLSAAETRPCHAVEVDQSS